MPRTIGEKEFFMEEIRKAKLVKLLINMIVFRQHTIMPAGIQHRPTEARSTLPVAIWSTRGDPTKYRKRRLCDEARKSPI